MLANSRDAAVLGTGGKKGRRKILLAAKQLSMACDVDSRWTVENPGHLASRICDRNDGRQDHFLMRLYYTQIGLSTSFAIFLKVFVKKRRFPFEGTGDSCF